jgi:hypothetical protein
VYLKMNKELQLDRLYVANISSDTIITIDDDLVLEGNITFNTPASNGDVLTFNDGSWKSEQPVAPPSTTTTETINSSGMSLTPNVDVSYLNTNGTATLPVTSESDGFSKKLVKTLAPIPSTPQQWAQIDSVFPNGQVTAIAFAPNGTHGPWSTGDLVIGGSFTNLGPNNANYVAYFDGSDWQPVTATSPPGFPVTTIAFSEGSTGGGGYNGDTGQLWVATNSPNFGTTSPLRGLLYRWTGPTGSFGAADIWEGMGLDISDDGGNLTTGFDGSGGRVYAIRFEGATVWAGGDFDFTFSSGTSSSEQVTGFSQMTNKRFIGIVEGAGYSYSGTVYAIAIGPIRFGAGTLFGGPFSSDGVQYIGRWAGGFPLIEPLQDGTNMLYDVDGPAYAAVEYGSNYVFGGAFTTRNQGGTSLPRLGIWNGGSAWTTPWSGDGVPNNTVQFATFHPTFTNHLWIVGKFTNLGTNNCNGIAFVDLAGGQFPINVWQRPDALNQPSISGLADFTPYSVAFDTTDSDRPYFGGAFTNLGPDNADYVVQLEDAVPGQPNVTVSVNGGANDIVLENIGDTQELIYNDTLGQWIVVNNV